MHQPAEGRGTSQGKVLEGKQIVKTQRGKTQHQAQRAALEPKNGRQSWEPGSQFMGIDQVGRWVPDLSSSGVGICSSSTS